MGKITTTLILRTAMPGGQSKKWFTEKQSLAEECQANNQLVFQLGAAII
jgi:hypothetical protein